MKDVLIEARNWAQEMRNTPGNNCLERAQFTCQVWNLDQMIKITDLVERTWHQLHNRQK